MRRVDTAHADAGYWRHKKLVTVPLARAATAPESPAAAAPVGRAGLPPQLQHWARLNDDKERERFAALYSGAYKTKKVSRWRMAELFSFVADAFTDAQEVEATGEPAWPGTIPEALQVDARRDVLVLRQVTNLRVEPPPPPPPLVLSGHAASLTPY